MSTTLTINLTQIIPTAPNAIVRIDLQNSANPRVAVTGQIVPQSLTLYPSAGVVTFTLFDNTQIVDSYGIFGSYYTFNFIFQGTITALNSYRLMPGSFNLSNLTPCVGSECIGNTFPAGGVAAFNEVPAGLVDGVNTVFTLDVTPLLVTVWDNFPLIEGTGFTITGNVITFTVAPQVGDVIYATGLFTVTS